MWPVLVAPLVAGALATATVGDARASDEPHARRLRYLALGDSYTIGEGVQPEGRWPMQLALALRAHGTAIEDPRILARTGWTTDELSAAIDAEFGADPGTDPGTAADPKSNAVVSADDSASRSRFDLVTLLIGVNNQYRGRSLAEYETQFDALLARAVAFAGGRADRVMVLAIPDWGVTPFAAQSGRDTARIAQELDAFSRARGGDAAMLVDDGLHPSAAMYAEWTALASPVAQRLLQARIR
jgi:lysophospholipase L1-like esterase